MIPTTEYLIAEAYARGRIDQGEDPFMDVGGVSSSATAGAFAYRYAQACAGQGEAIPLATAWSVFDETRGRSVEVEPAHEVEDEMATHEQAAAITAATESGVWPDVCLSRRTYMGAATAVCTLRAGHRGPHTATASDGRIVATWTTGASDAALAERVHTVRYDEEPFVAEPAEAEEVAKR